MHTIDVEEAAEEAAGNWRTFESFSWWGRDSDTIPDPENWALVYTSNRDSGLLDQSNAAAIDRIMEPFTEAEPPTAVAERHDSWLCGWVDGYAIRVYNPDGSICEAFEAWCDIQDRLESYASLDDENFSRREYEATIKNIEENGRYALMKTDFDWEPKWAKDVWQWLWDNEQMELESVDDRGGWPSEEAILRACYALNLIPDPDTFPASGRDLITIDRHNFFLADYQERGPVVWVPEGHDWRTAVRRYFEESGEPDIKAWLVTGPDLTDCQILEVD